MSELSVADLRYVAQQLEDGESMGDTYVHPMHALRWAADRLDAQATEIAKLREALQTLADSDGCRVCLNVARDVLSHTEETT